MRKALPILIALCAGGGAEAATPSRLGLARLVGDRGPKLVLAQRAIEREWTVSGDSGVAGLRLQGARSELGAAALSAAVPGAGQLYAGRASGFYYVAAEVAGWVGLFVLRRDAGRLRDDAGALAGSPDDSASAWSFERWQDATTGDPSMLRALYAVDRDAFYDAIASDDRYAPGWSSTEKRSRFGDLRHRADRSLEHARWTGAGLWLNHLIAAADALRVARLYNLDLELADRVDLRARGRLADGRPALVVTLERRF